MIQRPGLAGRVKVVGLVLAGGRSSRFGSEKAVADIDGRSMIAAVAHALSQGCKAVAVNASPGSGAAAWALAEGRPLLPDPPGSPDGPLTGVLEGLRWAGSEGADLLVTAPCDTPKIPADMVERLAAAGGLCAYAVSPEGPHPLCAAWRIDRLGLLQAVLADGHPSVRSLLDTWSGARVAFPDPRAFANVNTPADASTPARTGP